MSTTTNPCRKTYFKNYYRTKEGLLTNIYGNQKHNSKRRGHSAPAYSKEELKIWLFSQIKFRTLFNNWKMSNYQKRFSPSIDRKDNDLGYSFDNIQLVTWEENKRLQAEDFKSGKLTTKNPQKAVLQFTREGKLVGSYVSIRQAERETGIVNQGISCACNKKYKTYCGFVWEFA